MPDTSVTSQNTELLAASELRYRRLFEAAKDGVLILDAATGRIDDVNPFLLSLLGLARADVLGKTVGELSPFKDLESNKRMLERLQEDGYVRYAHLPLETVDGRQVDVEFVCNVYEAGDERVIQCNIRDITERVRADGTIRRLENKSRQHATERLQLEAQFIEAQKMEAIGQLSAGVAHDFNNVLGVIMGYADILAKELEQDSPLKPFADEIRYAADRAAGLTRQLLVISRRHKVQLGVLNLNDVVNDVEKMLRRLMGASIAFRVSPGANLGSIRADAGYMGQVLLNLVVNARDAMADGGTLTIATENVSAGPHTLDGMPPGEYVALSVTDSGTGMTPDVKAHLFEPFFTTKPTGQGTGLGLATCQTIIQQSDGHIDVRTDEGVGTTFRMYFPRVETPADASTDATGPLQSAVGTETLLVVEDEPALRDLTRDVLRAQGYQVLTASNGLDGLRVASAHKGAPIRLVVTDVIMPLMGGTAMANSLRTANPNIRILFTSGYLDDTVALGGELASGIAFLPKPFSVARLCNRVRAMLDAKAGAVTRDV